MTNPRLVALRAAVLRRTPRNRLIVPDVQVEGYMNTALRNRWERHFGKIAK